MGFRILAGILISSFDPSLKYVSIMFLHVSIADSGITIFAPDIQVDLGSIARGFIVAKVVNRVDIAEALVVLRLVPKVVSLSAVLVDKSTSALTLKGLLLVE